MAKKFRGGAHWKNGYSAYATRGSWRKNRVRALERHIKKYPEDMLAKKALKNLEDGNTGYVRNRRSRDHECKNDPHGIVPVVPEPSVYAKMLALGFKTRMRERNIGYRR